MCDSRSKLSCSSNCCIVLTPAQVIMGCYSVCQSAHSRLLSQPLLPVTSPSLQKPFHWKHHVASASGKPVVGHCSPSGSQIKQRRIPSGAGSHRGRSAHTCPSRNNPWPWPVCSAEEGSRLLWQGSRDKGRTVF